MKLISKEDAIESITTRCYPSPVFQGTMEEYAHFLLKGAETRMEIPDSPRGVYQCFHCGSYSVIWGADFDFSDYGLEGEGIVHSCHCANCGADIEYYVRIDDEQPDENNI